MRSCFCKYSLLFRCEPYTCVSLVQHLQNVETLLYAACLSRYRRLFILFSRYTYVNRLEPLELTCLADEGY